MKTKPYFAVIVVSLLICTLFTSCTGDDNAEPTQTIIPATSTPVPTDLPTLTPTETPLPSPTPQPSPTPIPGQFLNRPDYLQELFSTTDWVWRDDPIGATLGTYQYNASTLIMLIYGTNPETADDLLMRGAFLIDSETRSEDEVFFQEFITILLEDFIPTPALEELLQFIADNPDLGTYESTIYGFEIYLSIKDDTARNTHNIVLIIDEKKEE
jgi:hypothetical protein